MRPIFLFTFIIFSLSFHLTYGGIFRRYVRKRSEGYRGPYNHQMAMSRSRMMTGPTLIERQFRLSRQRPWPMFVRRARAPPQLVYHYPLHAPIMMQTAPSIRSRASRRYRFYDRLDSNRVPQFHHQPASARHHVPIGISTTTRLPTTSAIQWRPFDYGNPIDRDPTYDYAPPAIERVRFVTEVRGNRRQPTARANTGMLGMYSRPAPVVVPAPWKRDPNIRSRHPGSVIVPQQYPQHLPPPPPRGALPLWKLLSSKQRQRRPQRPVRPQQQQQQPTRFIGQDPKFPLYHHQVYHDEAEVFPHIPNIVYFQPTDISKPNYAKKNIPSTIPKSGRKPSSSGPLKPGTVSNAPLYSKEVSSSSEFRPIKPSRPVSNKPVQGSGNKAYQFTVYGYSGPAATTPMSPVAVAPSVSSPSTTKRPPTVLYAVKTTPETLSTTHNSVVKPLEPTESLEPEEEEAASELRPVHVLPDSPSVAAGMLDDDNDHQEVEDGREQGGLDVDFDNQDDTEQQQQQQPAPVPVVPNSFNVFESLLSSFEKEFGGDALEGADADEEEVHEVKNIHHRQRVPVFEPAEDSTLKGVLLPAEIITTSAPSRNNNFETSTSISMSVGISSSSSSSSSNKNKKPVIQTPVEETNEDDDVDGYFANIKIVPTTSTTTTSTSTTTTTTTTEKPTTTTSESPSTTVRSSSTSTAYPRLPTMPTYKRKPTPVYSKKSSKAGGLLSKYSSSSSSVSKEVSATGGAVPNGSGEVVIITAGRSKVKEYKPQIIANQTNLLAFDKVMSAVDGESVKETPIIFSSDASPSSTTKSPLEDFDAMQLLHSWLNKA